VNADEVDADQTEPPDDEGRDTSQPPLRTRAGLAWVAVCAAALIAIALVVFIAQNTQRVHVSFLWLDSNPSLAVVALISVISGSIVTVVAGTVRIVQLRRALRRRRS
jgi:uncharacterized integral membrane protein